MTFRSSIKLRKLCKQQAASFFAVIAALSLLSSGCFVGEETDSYYGQIVVPRTHEFRWSDGGLPQIFDPARAAVPPDTDAVRALFEGLTEYDPRTLAPVPGVAMRWESSEDGRVWTFHLRRDAHWTNGEAVTAHDFVRSWQRALQLGERAPHIKLLQNIQGASHIVEITGTITAENKNSTAYSDNANKTSSRRGAIEGAAGVSANKSAYEAEAKPTPFGATAVDDYTLRVILIRPDQNFPALVAHTVFRPIHAGDFSREDNDNVTSPQSFVSNGAFQLVQQGRSGVILERSGKYWDAQSVGLERVRFVATKDAEEALALYRAGEVDAVTNAGFEPLVLKLLRPYEDFHRETFGALAYYSFNMRNKPFDDVRVRRALALAIDRDRISEDELGGATEPAKKFLPTQIAKAEDDSAMLRLEYDASHAQKILAEAGFPHGQNFPRIHLLINRNDQQRVIAQSIAAMWRSVLGIETDIVGKNWDEYEATVHAGDYDLVRRGLVMQSTDEATNLREMFESNVSEVIALASLEKPQQVEPHKHKLLASPEGISHSSAIEERDNTSAVKAEAAQSAQINTEEEALRLLPAIPIYFASSYALVKPYITGFNANLLDAPSLKCVRLNTAWRAPESKTSAVWFN
jgi:ABC-type oligopeptide transport system substrate-binding subunit